MGVTWEIGVTDEFDTWYMNLDTSDATAIADAVDMLAEHGPRLGRPLVDQITGSRHHNLKELRAGTLRVLFAFDPNREAVLLVGWDKRGTWTASYRDKIKQAERLYDEWLGTL